MIRKAADLSEDQKLAIESLIGQRLSEQDNVSVRKLPTQPELSAERRKEIAEGLRRYFAQVDVQRQPMSEEEAEALINERLRSVKPGYRPINCGYVSNIGGRAV
jgi:hypothetical protein